MEVLDKTADILRTFSATENGRVKTLKKNFSFKSGRKSLFFYEENNNDEIMELPSALVTSPNRGRKFSWAGFKSTSESFNSVNATPNVTPSSRRRKISRASEKVAGMVRSFSTSNLQSQRQKKGDGDGDQMVTSRSSSLQRNDARVSSLKSGVFGSTKELSRVSLTDTLKLFEANDIDFFPDGTDVEDMNEEDVFLEESWTDVIDPKEGMLGDHKIQQEAIWELLTTERNYIRKLRVIVKVFRKCLVNLQKKNFLTDVEDEKLFSNISEVYNANRTFWFKYLKQVVEEARTTKEPIRPSQLLDSFAKFEDLFQPYIKYCMRESLCAKYLKELKSNNEPFKEYLLWCENHPQCHRLKLAEFLVKPMQRVTKYGLLLRAVAKKTSDDEERLSLENMMSQVERFVTKINTKLRMRQEQQKLEEVVQRIDLYSPVDTTYSEEVDKIALSYCNLNLYGKIPGLREEEPRCILMEGPMKMIEKHGKTEVHVFLFTDVFVLAKMKKNNNDKLRIIRQPFRLNKIITQPLNDPGSFLFIYLNEYGVLVTAFTLQVGISEFTKWHQAIERAKERYEGARNGLASTLDFFDDDIPTSGSFSYASPMPNRHSMAFEDQPSSPSIVVTEDALQLRSRSTATIEHSSHAKTDQQSSEAIVKRSLSDPKSVSWTREKKARSRPISLISTSDRDTASWVLTNEKRNRSGSIPSDVSEDSRRSSGIGDSFRSINSDGALPQSNGTAIQPFSSYPEVSHVLKLKARFESQEFPEGSNSNSSISNTSAVVDSNMTPVVSTTVSTAITTRRATPPDFMENHSTIQEEEEHSSNNSHEKITEANANISDDAESIMTSSTVRYAPGDTDDNPYENIGTLRDKMRRSTSITEQVDTKIKHCGVQCKLSHENLQMIDMSINSGVSEIESLLEESKAEMIKRDERLDSVDSGKDVDIVSLAKKDASTQMLDTNEHSEIAIQCSVTRDTCNVGTQCGDFIQLSGVCEGETADVESNSVAGRPSSAPSSPEIQRDMPLLNLLRNMPDNSKQPKGILKHAYSEANLGLIEGLVPPTLNVTHTRSRSDEPKAITVSPKQKHRNSTTTYDYPGMRALQSLSESLESSLQNRTDNLCSRPIVKSYDNKSESSANKGASPSLRHVASTNSSSPSHIHNMVTGIVPNGIDKEHSTHNTESHRMDSIGETEERPSISRTTSELTKNTPAFTVLRDKSTRNNDDKKRKTWHDFDSAAELHRIETTKYGPEGRIPKNEANQAYFSLQRSQSQSTEQLSYSPKKKSNSFKKAVLRKFSQASLLDKGENKSPSDDLTDEKSVKKQQKREQEKIKKEKKLKEKEEKKREKQEKSSKRRSGSFSSITSAASASTPKISANSNMTSIEELSK